MTKIQERALMRKIKRTQKKKDGLNNENNKRKEEEEEAAVVEGGETVQPKSKLLVVLSCRLIIHVNVSM